MALSETAISTLLVASVTGEGLVLAVYALITSISDKIIVTRRELIKENNEKFSKAMDEYSAHKTDANLKSVNASHNRLKNLRSFPSIFSSGMLFSFVFYVVCSTMSFLWFVTHEYLGSSYEDFSEIYAMIFFYAATATFFAVGVFTIAEVARVLKRKWKVLEEEKQEVEKTASDKLTKLEKKEKIEKTSGEEYVVLKKDIEEPKRENAKTTLKTDFSLLRFKEEVDMPIKSSWSIRIWHPDRPIERCSVTYEGTRLPWWDKHEPYYAKFIDRMTGGNVRIPKGTEREDFRVIVWDGKKKIREEVFKDIPVVDA